MQLRGVVSLVDGHNILRKHLQPLGLVIRHAAVGQDLGRLSRIIQRDALAKLRYFFLVSPKPDPEDIRKINPRSILALG